MKKIDKDGLILCDIQADIFEQSIDRFECSSEIFIRRFTNSQIVKLFDDKSILENSYSEEAIFDSLLNEYGKLSYGKSKYTKNEMYWIGYTYRYFCYTYDINMKQAYSIVSPKEMRSVFIPYHSLDCPQAIERILEAKNISFDKNEMLKKGVELLRVLKKTDDPYIVFPTFGNERFLLRRIENTDISDLLKVYSDKDAIKYFNSDNCNGDTFNCTTLEQMKQTMEFWNYSYEHRYFIRWAIVDKTNNNVIGTIEQFHRDSNDYFTNCSLLRIDLRSDYEKKDIIKNILKLIVPSSYQLFNCNKVVTKSFDENIERENALYELGFKKINKELIGHKGEKYYGYWEIHK